MFDVGFLFCDRSWIWKYECWVWGWLVEERCFSFECGFEIGIRKFYDCIRIVVFVFVDSKGGVWGLFVLFFVGDFVFYFWWGVGILNFFV